MTLVDVTIHQIVDARGDALQQMRLNALSQVGSFIQAKMHVAAILRLAQVRSICREDIACGNRFLPRSMMPTAHNQPRLFHSLCTHHRLFIQYSFTNKMSAQSFISHYQTEHGPCNSLIDYIRIACPKRIPTSYELFYPQNLYSQDSPSASKHSQPSRYSRSEEAHCAQPMPDEPSPSKS